jgi:hypothetical protein
MVVNIVTPTWGSLERKGMGSLSLAMVRAEMLGFARFFVLKHQHPYRADSLFFARLHEGAYADPFGLSSVGLSAFVAGFKEEDPGTNHGGLTPTD